MRLRHWLAARHKILREINSIAVASTHTITMKIWCGHHHALYTLFTAMGVE